MMFLIQNFGGWILGIISALGAIFVMFQSSKKVGKAEAQIDAIKRQSEEMDALAARKIREAREANQRETTTVKEASDVKTDVNKLDDGGAINELRDKWTRD